MEITRFGGNTRREHAHRGVIGACADLVGDGFLTVSAGTPLLASLSHPSAVLSLILHTIARTTELHSSLDGAELDFGIDALTILI
jgi:hypothetical protein